MTAESCLEWVLLTVPVDGRMKLLLKEISPARVFKVAPVFISTVSVRCPVFVRIRVVLRYFGLLKIQR